MANLYKELGKLIVEIIDDEQYVNIARYEKGHFSYPLLFS